MLYGYSKRGQQMEDELEPLSGYVPEIDSEQYALPSLSKRVRDNTVDVNTVDLAREDPGDFFDKVGRFADGAWEGLSYGWNYGVEERAWRSWRTLGVILDSQSMQDTASEALADIRDDPDRTSALASIKDPIARQSFSGMASVLPSLASSIPGIVAGLATGGAGWIPGILGALSAGGSGGLAEFDSFIEEAHSEMSIADPSLTVAEVRDLVGSQATMSAFAEGGFEAAFELVGGALARRTAKPLASLVSDISPGAAKASDVLSRNFFGRLMKNTFVNQPLAEVPSEMATAGIQDKLRENAGLSSIGVAAAVSESIVPALVASFPFGITKSIQYSPEFKKGQQDVDAVAFLEKANIEYKEAVSAATIQYRASLQQSPAYQKLKAVSEEISGYSKDTVLAQEEHDLLNDIVDVRLKGIDKDAARDIVILSNNIDVDIFDALGTAAAATGATTKLPDVDGSLLGGFKKYLTGVTEEDAERAEYYNAVEEALIDQMRTAESAGLLQDNLKITFNELVDKHNGVYDAELHSHMLDTMKTQDLQSILAKRVSEEVGAKITDIDGMSKDQWEQVLNGDLRLTEDTINNSKDKTLAFLVSSALSKEAGADPTLKEDGSKISEQDIQGFLRGLKKDPDAEVLWNGYGLLKGLQNNKMIMSSLLARADMSADSVLQKVTMLELDTKLDPTKKTFISESLQADMINYTKLEALGAELGTQASNLMRQRQGGNRKKLAQLYNNLGKALPSMMESPESINLQFVKTMASRLVEDVASSKGVKSRQSRILVKNMRKKIKNIEAALKENPDMSLQEFQEVVNSGSTQLDKGINDDIIADVKQALKDPAIVNGYKKQMREAKMGLVKDAAQEYMFNNMLSGISTQLTSVIGGGIGVTLDVAEKALGSKMFTNDSFKTGVSNHEWFVGMQAFFSSMWNRGWSSWRDVALERRTRTLAAAGVVDKTGDVMPSKAIAADRVAEYKGYQSWEDYQRNSNYPNTMKFLGKLLDVSGFVVRTPGRILEAGDGVVEDSVYASSIAAQTHSWEQANQQKLAELPDSSLRRDLMQEMHDNALAEAKHVTLKDSLDRNDGAFLKVAGGLDAIRTKSFAAKMILPFFRIGANVAYNYATANPVTGMFTKYYKNAMESGNPKQIMEADSRLILGSSLTYMAMLAAGTGLITGAAPKNQEERDLWYAAGNQPYSMRVGDAWFSYNRTDPIATFLAMAADLTTAGSNLRDKDAGEGLATLLGTAVQTTIDKTFFKGIYDALQAVNDPGTHSIKMLQNTFNMFVPGSSMWRSLSKATQETMVTADGFMGNLFKDYLFGALDKSEKVAPRRTVLGDKVDSRAGRWGSAMSEAGLNNWVGESLGIGASMVLPTDYSPKEADPVYGELYRLKAKGLPSSIGMGVSKLNFKDTSGRHSRSVDLTMDEQSAYKEMRGNQIKLNGLTLKETIRKLFSDPKYQTFTDENKVRLLNRITNRYNRATKKSLIKRFPAILTR